MCLPDFPGDSSRQTPASSEHDGEGQTRCLLQGRAAVGMSRLHSHRRHCSSTFNLCHRCTQTHNTSPSLYDPTGTTVLLKGNPKASSYASLRCYFLCLVSDPTPCSSSAVLAQRIRLSMACCQASLCARVYSGCVADV